MIVTDTEEQAVVLAALDLSRQTWLGLAEVYGNPGAADAAEKAKRLLMRFDPKGRAKGRWS